MKTNELIHISLPNKSTLSLPKGVTGTEIAKQLPPKITKSSLAIEVNGTPQDLSTPIMTDATIRMITWEDLKGKEIFWHSSAHLLAEALQALYPSCHLGIGPPIAQGFYYDVDFNDSPFDASHLPTIEKKMKELAAQKSFFQRIEISKKKAIEHFTNHYNPYKLELLERLEDGNITFYKQGNFTDLCKGVHIPHTSHIKSIKLLHIAGAYWQGDEKRKQLTRLYGISFPKQSLLQAYLTRIEEAKKRDHRKLGKELKLFAFSQEVGNGLPLWLPKGTFIREQLVKFLKEAQAKAGYQSVITPHIGHKNLYITSGHYQKYKEDTFQPIKTPQPDEEFFLKPMNCPHHCAIYKNSPKSYKELPLRFAEFGTVYRYEQSGELHGLARVRGFTQDDAHIFCRVDQLKEELLKLIDLVFYVLNKFEFHQHEIQISLRDPAKKEKYIGSDHEWAMAEQAIQEAVEAKGLHATTVLGEASFYGPKIDFMIQDAIGRKWQLGTVQIDYQLPQRFDLTYIGADNQKHRPVMIHRAPFGSIERFMALLIEHTAGKFPLWLAPCQVIILPIGGPHTSYAQAVQQQLAQATIRATVDERDEKVGRKIRDAEVAKIPYMLILGDQEVATHTVSIRKQGKGQQGNVVLTDFINELSSLLAS